MQSNFFSNNTEQYIFWRLITYIFLGLSKDPNIENKTPSEFIFWIISLTLPSNFKCMRWSFREKKELNPSKQNTCRFFLKN